MSIEYCIFSSTLKIEVYLLYLYVKKSIVLPLLTVNIVNNYNIFIVSACQPR